MDFKELGIELNKESVTIQDLLLSLGSVSLEAMKLKESLSKKERETMISVYKSFALFSAFFGEGRDLEVDEKEMDRIGALATLAKAALEAIITKELKESFIEAYKKLSINIEMPRGFVDVFEQLSPENKDKNLKVLIKNKPLFKFVFKQMREAYESGNNVSDKPKVDA